jgi:hypothetical protein
VRADFVAVSNCLNGIAGTERGNITARGSCLCGNKIASTSVLGSFANLEEAYIAGNEEGINMTSGTVHCAFAVVSFNTIYNIDQNGGELNDCNYVIAQGSAGVGHYITGGTFYGGSNVFSGNRSHGRHVAGMGQVNCTSDTTSCNGGSGLFCDGGRVRDTASYSWGNADYGKWCDNGGIIIGAQSRTNYNTKGLGVDNGGRIRQWLGQTASNITSQVETDGTGGTSNTLSAKGSYLGTS